MKISKQSKKILQDLLKLGQDQGYLTQDEVLEAFPEIEEDLSFLEFIIVQLQEASIEIIEPSVEKEVQMDEKSMDFDTKIEILKRIRSHISTDPIRAYLHEIGKIPLLSANEEVILSKRIEAGEDEIEKIIKDLASKKYNEVFVEAAKAIRKDIYDDPNLDLAKKRLSDEDRRFLNTITKDGIEAKNYLTTANLRLVVSIAKKYAKRGLDLLDLIQEGNIGLMRAVEKFEYKKGFKFSTYATWWIRQAITRAIADQARTIRIPVHMIETINKLSKVINKLSAKYGRTPKAEEIAEEMEMDIEKVHEIVKIAQRPSSLDSPIGEDQDSHLGDIIPDEYSVSPADLASWSYLKKQVNKMLERLTDREKKVLELRFGLKDGVSRTLEEVGHEFKVTRERIRQIEAKALKGLKSPEIKQAFEDYLK